MTNFIHYITSHLIILLIGINILYHLFKSCAMVNLNIFFILTLHSFFQNTRIVFVAVLFGYMHLHNLCVIGKTYFIECITNRFGIVVNVPWCGEELLFVLNCFQRLLAVRRRWLEGKRQRYP